MQQRKNHITQVSIIFLVIFVGKETAVEIEMLKVKPCTQTSSLHMINLLICRNDYQKLTLMSPDHSVYLMKL